MFFRGSLRLSPAAAAPTSPRLDLVSLQAGLLAIGAATLTGSPDDHKYKVRVTDSGNTYEAEVTLVLNGGFSVEGRTVTGSSYGPETVRTAADAKELILKENREAAMDLEYNKTTLTQRMTRVGFTLTTGGDRTTLIWSFTKTVGSDVLRVEVQLKKTSGNYHAFYWKNSETKEQVAEPSVGALLSRLEDALE